MQTQLSTFATTDAGSVRGEGKAWKPKYYTKQSVERELTQLKSNGGMQFQNIRDGNREYVENDQAKTQVLANIDRIQALYTSNSETASKSMDEEEIRDLV